MKFETFENRTHSQMSPKELIKYNTNEYDKQLILFFFFPFLDTHESIVSTIKHTFLEFKII